MNENDLRVQRTRSLLKESLIDLVTREGYEAVTIRDITQHAQVGYKTFFRHYESKEALLQTLIDGFIGEFQAELLPPSTADAVEKNTLTVLRFTEKNAGLMRMILRSSAVDQLLKPLMRMGVEDGKRFFGGSGIPDEIVAHHFASSMIGIIRWWLASETEYAIEEMAEYIERLLIQPLNRLKN